MARISQEEFKQIREAVPVLVRELGNSPSANQVQKLAGVIVDIQMRVGLNTEVDLTEKELADLQKETMMLALLTGGVSGVLTTLNGLIENIARKQIEAIPIKKNEQTINAEVNSFKPRNEFENFLADRRFNLGDLYSRTLGKITPTTSEKEAQLYRREYYQTLGDYLLSVAFDEHQESIVLATAKVPKLGEINYDIKVMGSPVKKDLMGVAKMGQKEIPDTEQAAAREVWDRIKDEVFFYDKLVDRDITYWNQYKAEKEGGGGAISSFAGIKQMFPESGADGEPYGVAAWKTIFNMRPLHYRTVEKIDGKDVVVWKEDDRPFGEKVYEALRQSIGRAYGQVAINAEGEAVYSFEQPGGEPLVDDLYSYISTTLDPKTDLAPEGLYAARLPDESGTFVQFALRTHIVGSEIHLPYKESVKQNTKKQRILFQLARSLAPKRERGLPIGSSSDVDYLTKQKDSSTSYPDPENPNDSSKNITRNTNYQLDNISAILGGVAITDITLFSPWTDRKMDGSKVSPEAVSLASRLMNYIRVVRKYTSEIQTGETDPNDKSTQFVADMNGGLMMDRFVRPYFQHYGYDGHTFEWHILANKKPSGVKWGNLPDDAFKGYGQEITHHLAPVEAVMDVSINLAGIAKFNPETGSLEDPDPKAVGKVIGLIRKLVDYNAIGYESPGAVQKEKEGNPGFQENPTGDFVAVEVYDRSGGQEKRVARHVTRIFGQYPMYAQHFYRWLPESVYPSKPPVFLWEKRNLTEEEVKKGEISKTLKLFVDTTADKKKLNLPEDLGAFASELNPKKLIERELVYRFLAGLLFPGKTQAELSERDIGVIMLIVGSMGKERIEQRWMQGPLPNLLTRFGLKLTESERIAKLVDSMYGKITTEVGNFSRRATYYMNDTTGDDQIRSVIHRINPRFNRLAKASDVVSIVGGFFTGKPAAKK